MALGRAYGALVGSTPMQPGDFWLEAYQDNITATASGTQATGFQINAQMARVTTVATAADSVLLPPSQPGLEVVVINHGANNMQVYGAGTDQIDDIATATGVSQMPNSFVIYSCVTAGNWYTDGLSTGFSKVLGLQTYSYATIAANVGGTQGTGTAVKSAINNVTAAGASYSITLPVSVPGVVITINNISTQTLLVFPNAGGTTTEAINGLGANNSISMSTVTSAQFVCVVAGQWYTLPRVPS
jgi:hypothetical protein